MCLIVWHQQSNMEEEARCSRDLLLDPVCDLLKQEHKHILTARCCMRWSQLEAQGFILQQDKNPKQTSGLCQDHLHFKWWRPAQCPDLNPLSQIRIHWTQSNTDEGTSVMLSKKTSILLKVSHIWLVISKCSSIIKCLLFHKHYSLFMELFMVIAC